ncbi:MAG: hypothetical protein WC307_04030 [Candidatus Nanoarchaeia archaeon]|jgi:hypothetical protein
MINRLGQSGMLLEVFILILILVLFTFFWNGFSRNIFLAGLLLIDDSSIRHSCSNMLPVIVGNNYITGSPDSNELSIGLLDYLGSSVEPQVIPSASFFYARINRLFPGLNGKVRISVISADDSSSAGLAAPDFLETLSAGRFKSSSCELPLYSINASVMAVVRMDVLI